MIAGGDQGKFYTALPKEKWADQFKAADREISGSNMSWSFKATHFW